MSSCGSNTYGIHKESHDRVHIEFAENGLKCNCVCPACQADLIARNHGKKRAPHFAHASGQACQWAGETDVHLMAKQILSEKKNLYFPSYRGKLYRANLAQQDFESVICEPFISGKRPDCVGIWKDSSGREIEIWVEIKVTHPVDDRKLELIKDHGITCIEIDLKQFAYLHELTDEFEEAVLEKAERVWLNAPFLDEIDRQKVEEDNRARQIRNDELRVTVARELKDKFDSSNTFEIPVPCMNVCIHRDECVYMEAHNCGEHTQRMVDIKKFYDLCEVLPSNVDNKVVRIQNSTGRFEPLYIAVFGERENFPDNVSDGKVLAVHMKSSYDIRNIFLMDDDPYSQYNYGYHPYYYEDNDDYPYEIGSMRRYYNFVEKEEKTVVGPSVRMNSFILHRSGKWFCDVVPCDAQFDNEHKGVFYRTFQFYTSTSYDDYLYGLAMAIDAGCNVRHCSICKHHKRSLLDRVGWCTKPEVGSKIERWSALSCRFFDRNDDLINEVKNDQPYLYD